MEEQNKKNTSSIKWTVIVILILLIIWGVTGSKKSVNTGSVRIGGAFLLTGPAALVGEVQKNAVTMAIDDVNKQGGINGRPLELVMEDAGYDPKTAVNAYQALKQKGLHLFLIDGSPVVAATHNLVIADGNFTIAGGATVPSYFDGSDRTCRIALTSRNLAPGMVELMLKHNYKRAATLLPDNEYGRGLSDEFNKAFTAKGGTVVASEFYGVAAGTADYRTNITKIKAHQGNIDAIVFSNPLNTLEPMLNQLKELGVTKPIISDEPTLDNPALKNLSLIEGDEFVNYEYSRTDSPTDSAAAKAFKDEYRSRYNTDPIYFGAAAYDSVMLITKAIKAVGEDPQKIGDYISSLQNYAGITGTFSFNSDCEVSRNSVFSTVKGGKIISE